MSGGAARGVPTLRDVGGTQERAALQRPVRDRSVRDRFAFLSLIAGICAWVPLVIVAAAPIAVGFALLSWVRTEGGGRGRLPPASRAGLVLTAVAVLIQAAAFGLASVFGWGDALLRWGVESVSSLFGG